MGVVAMKHEALLREWREKIAECRTSGESVRTWCAERGIGEKRYYYWEKRVLAAAAGETSLPAAVRKCRLARIIPDTMPGSESGNIGAAITIRHGESVISLPAGSCLETVADLVKALNRHA